MDWSGLADRVLAGHAVSRNEALSIVKAANDELLSVLQAAYKIRSHYHGRKVKVHVLQNAKSGGCSEDCAFCSQSMKYNTGIAQYRLQTVDELVQGAQNAYAMGAVTYCMVTATRGPSARDIETVCEATRQIKEKYPLKICASLGILQPGQAQKLYEAGVNRYNHNLETSSRYFPEIVSTHSFAARVDTIKQARQAGMEACCGGIIGMGEEIDDWVDLALQLRDLEVESIPVNFLDARSGTLLGDRLPLHPQVCLKVLAMFRFVHPSRDVRVAGGREAVLGPMQPLALYAANSLFTNGYLTTPGQGNSKDYQIIQAAGFEAEVIRA
ncbi:MAG: biotin synthase BioB [Cyanothece sp. SIO1E1]|nr:biotin synthase BioB [Cyanothece sp. SIO1E1]